MPLPLNPSPSQIQFPSNTTKNPIALLFGWLALAVAPTHAVHAAEGVGSITGMVSNAATRNLLEGAKVEVPQLGLAALTDTAGRFVLSAVPAGAHELVVSYVGLDPARSQVTVAAGARVVRDFDLTTAIYQLGTFQVLGEREGGAAAITAQRNAPNLKNVLATDSFGNLPNMNAGEMIMRLPGVSGSLTEEGLASAFSIRGMGASLNTITMDGSGFTPIGATREFQPHTINGAMYEQVELTKGHTPDKGADSLGGTVNFKSRSALNMKEKRRVTYNLTARIAPSFTQQIPIREQHRSHPIMSFGYQEVFDVFGGQRNLGVTVNTFYSENAVGTFRTDRDFQNTTTQPAYVWSYQTLEIYNLRKQRSIGVKTDYRLSASTKMSINLTAADNYQWDRRDWFTRAYTGTQTQNTVPNATTTSIVPGFTDLVTQVRAVPTSTIDMRMIGPNLAPTRMRRLDLAAEQDFGPLQLDYAAAFSYTHSNTGQHKGGDLTMRITNVGWILDRTQSDLYPRFTQTAGPDFTNFANYRPAPNGLTLAKTRRDNEHRLLRANARYKLPTQIPTFLKIGGQWREMLTELKSLTRRWSYNAVGPPLPPIPDRLMFDEIKTGRRIPQWESTYFFSDHELKEPALWSEDNYFREASKYTNTKTMTETVTAGYVMADGKFGREGLLGRTGYLGGVRTEKTDTVGNGWVLTRANARSTAAQQLADPVGAAERDYAGTRRETEGSYTKSFPSAHLTHDITANLKTRVSWSTGFGRPSINNAVPGENANENNQTLTINNPALGPQTAKNWDATLDYYFEPVGNLSVGWFKKTIKDYIVTGLNTGTIGLGNDNGYNGAYENFTRLQSVNAGTAVVQGWEFGYQQQFTFLPGVLKGLSASANYTVIDTRGDFGSSGISKTGQVAGFIPRSANLMLSWRYRGFSTRVLYNYNSDYIVSYDAANVGRNSYRRAYKIVHFGLAYQLRPSVTLTCDVSNLFNAPQILYRGVPSQMQATIINGSTITVGVSGRF